MQDRLRMQRDPDLQQLDVEGKQYRGIMAEDMERDSTPELRKNCRETETVATEFQNTRPDAVFGTLRLNSLDDLYVEKETTCT